MDTWTEADKQVVRDIFASEKSVKELAHLLPSCTHDRIYRKGIRMGLVKRAPVTVQTRVHDLMSDGGPRTIAAVMEATGAQKSLIGEILNKLVKTGAIHISGYAGSRTAPVYKLGAGENADRPPAKTQAEYRAEYRAKYREMRDASFRAAAPPADAWWPWADPVVLQSMSALVRVGRSTA